VKDYTLSEIIYDEMKGDFKGHKFYLHFLTNYSNATVQLRLFTIYRNTFVHESILKLLLDHNLFKDLKQIKLKISDD